jgi:hypothetical protein
VPSRRNLAAGRVAHQVNWARSRSSRRFLRRLYVRAPPSKGSARLHLQRRQAEAFGLLDRRRGRQLKLLYHPAVMRTSTAAPSEWSINSYQRRHPLLNWPPAARRATRPTPPPEPRAEAVGSHGDIGAAQALTGFPSRGATAVHGCAASMSAPGERRQSRHDAVSAHVLSHSTKTRTIGRFLLGSGLKVRAF